MFKRFTRNLFIVVFAIFVGAQIKEGCLMVPHWKSMEAQDFYAYYNSFGPSIGKFFTILTVVAALIAIGLAAYQLLQKSRQRYWSMGAALCMIICLAMFYLYFKGANELFYAGALDANGLQLELERWHLWHNIRVLIEIIALILLCLGLSGEVSEDRNVV